MEINRLDKDELSYELIIRGIADTKTVDEMRVTLRHLLKLEKSGSLVYPSYPFTFVQDKTWLDKKLLDIEVQVQGFSDADTSGNFIKIKSKLLHCFKRAERALATNNEEKKSKSQLLLKIVTLESELRAKARRFKRASQVAASPLDVSALLSSTNIDSSGSESDTDEPPIPNASALPVATHSQLKVVPVSKWNITRFDGDSSRISLNAFLENVEELRLSRNVSHQQLFNSASDLLTGKALIWFRSIRSEVHSWPELVDQMRLQFLPTDYNDKLVDEIKKRTQGPTETIGIYIAIMTNMFNRLTVPVGEPAKLKILLKNISPFYQSQLGLVKVESVKQLLELGRQLESRKESIDAFIPPPRNLRNVMEPDLAYVYTSSNSSTSADPEVELLECWICKKDGHLAAQCPSKSQRRYCFKCGNPGFTTRTCPKCNSNSGNLSGGR